MAGGVGTTLLVGVTICKDGFLLLTNAASSILRFLLFDDFWRCAFDGVTIDVAGDVMVLVACDDVKTEETSCVTNDAGVSCSSDVSSSSDCGGRISLARDQK